MFWENHSECLHCPGIHPSLWALVPVYAQGIMAANEAAGWRADQVKGPLLRAGAESWTPTASPPPMMAAIRRRCWRISGCRFLCPRPGVSHPRARVGYLSQNDGGTFIEIPWIAEPIMSDDLHDPPRLIALLAAVWGQGFLSPGGAEAVARVIGAHDLTGASVLDIG